MGQPALNLIIQEGGGVPREAGGGGGRGRIEEGRGHPESRSSVHRRPTVDGR